MANHTHSSSGGGGFRVDLDMTDFTQEISEGIKAAIHRALVRIGMECESYVITGRLRNSITARRGLYRRGIHTQTHLTTALTTWSCALRIPCTHLSPFAVNRKMLRSLAGPFSFWTGRFSVRII